MFEKSNLISVGGKDCLNINWELVSHCQFKCSYCYYKPFKSNTNYVDLSKIVIRQMRELKEPAKVTLLGGEPSLHPCFEEVIADLSLISHVEEICIVTNFKKNLKFWKGLINFRKKIKIVISYHAEYEIKDLFEKIDALLGSIEMDFVFVVHNELKYLDRMKEVAEQIQRDRYLPVSLNFVPVHEDGLSERKYVNYPEQIAKFMLEQQERTRGRDNVETLYCETKEGMGFEIPKFDVLSQKINYFKGWECNLGAYIIHEDGMVSRACSGERKHVLLTEFEHFNLKCPYTLCECDDYWSFKKKRI